MSQSKIEAAIQHARALSKGLDDLRDGIVSLPEDDVQPLSDLNLGISKLVLLQQSSLQLLAAMAEEMTKSKST